MNKARNRLKARGIQARKDNKARLERIRQTQLTGDLVPVEDLLPIREPDKDPTAYEKATCTEEAYPELVQQVREIEARQYPEGDDPAEVVFRLGSSGIPDIVEDYLDSSPPPEELIDSSDKESGNEFINQVEFIPIPDFSDM